MVGWFGSATDIEALMQAEAARRESEERFRLLVEGARVYAMFLLDPDNRIAYGSTGAERVLGWSEAEVIGADGSLIFTPDDRAAGALEREIRVIRSRVYPPGGSPGGAQPLQHESSGGICTLR